MTRALLFFCLLPFFTIAQPTHHGGLVLRGGYEYSEFTGSDFNDFVRNYNAYYGGNMKSPMDTLALTASSHPEMGIGVRYYSGENFGFSTSLILNYGQRKFGTESTFANDIVTAADFRVRDWTAQIDLGIHIKKVLFLHGHLAGRFRRSVLDLGYYYQDGSYSLGNEYDILGVYQANTTTLDVGGGLGLKLGPVFIPVSISFPTNAFSDDGLLTLMDFDKRQIRWNDLPRDFETWVNDPASLDLDEGFVRAQSFRTWRINIGIELLIGG
ncbi:MAG: hypothetical protein KDC54_15105 [Lewinella sp.]|nr:hypothetical protein [Lewinella sp.]